MIFVAGIRLINCKNIKIADFTYDLPDERIAKYPLIERDNSKLLVSKNGELIENSFKNCAELLPENAQLVIILCGDEKVAIAIN